MKICRKLAFFITLAVMAASMPFYAFATDTGAVTEGDPAPAVTEPEAVQDGWAENKTVYYENGIRITSAVKQIGKNLYYFNAKGKVTTKKDAWIKVDGEKYRFNAKGKLVTKPTYIKNSKGKKILYMFRTDGRLLVKKEGLFKYKDKEYYSLGNGKLQTGWVAVKKQAMYFNKRNDRKTGTLGSMAKKTKIGHLKLPKNGRLGEAYALGVKQLDEIGWSLRATYKYSYRLKYRERSFRQNTTEDYAIRGFKRGNGNCYVMASTFYVMAKLLGYDITRVAGKVAGVNPHSWTVIKEDGAEHVYDPNFTNETGRDGWKIWYGKKGTWRYTNYYKVKNLF